AAVWGGGGADAAADARGPGGARGAPPARRRRPVAVGVGPGLLVPLADSPLHRLVADHDEVPGLGIGAGGPVDRGGQDLNDQRVRNVLIGEAADRALAAKQL